MNGEGSLRRQDDKGTKRTLQAGKRMEMTTSLEVFSGGMEMKEG